MVVSNGGEGWGNLRFYRKSEKKKKKKNQKTLKKVSAVEPKTEVWVLWAFDTKRKTQQEALLVLKASVRTQ